MGSNDILILVYYTDIEVFDIPCGRKRKRGKMKAHKLKKRQKKMRYKKK